MGSDTELDLRARRYLQLTATRVAEPDRGMCRTRMAALRPAAPVQGTPDCPWR